MIRSRRLFTVLTTLALALVAGAAPKLTDFFPANSLFVLHGDNTAESRRLWQASPWAKTWADEQVQHFFAPLLQDANFTEAREKIKTETGKSLEEILELFNAQIGMAVTHFEMDETGSQPDVHGVMILELGGKRSVLEEMLKHAENQKERVEDFRGVPVHELIDEKDKAGEAKNSSEPKMFWALLDDYWIVTTPKAAMEKTIVAIQQGGAAESLSKATAYAAVAQRSGNPPFSLYLNAARIVQLVGQAMEKGMAKDAAKNPQANPMGLTAPIILRASGLDTMEAIYIGANIGEDFTESRSAVTFTEERGITKLLAASHGIGAKPNWIKANWTKAGVVNLPIPHVYTLIEEIVQGLNPGMLTMMQGQMQMMQQNLGIDLKRDLIEVLGDTMVVGYVPKSGEADLEIIQQGQNLLAISTPNPQQLTATIETFGTMGGKMPKSMFEIREYLGAKIYSLPANPRAPQSRVSFAVHDGYFLFTAVPDAHPIEAVLQSMHSGEGESLWDQPQLRQAIADLPPEAIGYTYQDMPALMVGMFDMFALLQGQADAAAAAKPEAENEGDDEEVAEEEDGAATPPPLQQPKKFVDPAQKPTLEQMRRYWSNSLGATWRDAHSWYSITKISHRPTKQ